MVYQYLSTDSSSLINVPHENSVKLRVLNTCSLHRFISCNSENCVQAVRIIGNTCSLRQNHVLNEFLRST